MREWSGFWEHWFLSRLLPLVGLDRSAFDNKSVSFEEHIRCEHNLWHYLYFIVLVRVKDPTEFTGPESYVDAMMKVGADCGWSPWSHRLAGTCRRRTSSGSRACGPCP